LAFDDLNPGVVATALASIVVVKNPGLSVLKADAHITETAGQLGASLLHNNAHPPALEALVNYTITYLQE